MPVFKTIDFKYKNLKFEEIATYMLSRDENNTTKTLILAKELDKFEHSTFLMTANDMKDYNCRCDEFGIWINNRNTIVHP